MGELYNTWTISQWSFYQKMLVFVWPLLGNFGYMEHKREWGKGSWSWGGSRGSLGCMIDAAPTRRDSAEWKWTGAKKRARDAATLPQGAAPTPQGERTTVRQGLNQAPPRPVSVALPPASAWGCPAQEEGLRRHTNLWGGVMGFEV